MSDNDLKPISSTHFEQVIQNGCTLLMDIMGYGQVNLLNKLMVLGYKISPASLSNILNNKGAGKDILRRVSEGIIKLVQSELGYSYNYEIFKFNDITESGWQQHIVPESEEDVVTQDTVRFHFDGRVPVQYKTAFFAGSHQEVVEVGVRLNTFSSYFTSQSDQVYKDHIIRLLERGVHFKCYLVEPYSAEASIYFADRAKIQKSEQDSVLEIKRVVGRLKALIEEFEQLHVSGKFEVFFYKHIPYSNFFIVDGATENGKMMVSNYLYGVRRAASPVWEFSRKANPPLYRKYWESVQYYISDSISLDTFLKKYPTFLI